MPSELVKRMRQKYPTEYSDLSDAELESKVLAKYPEYKDLAAPSSQQAASETPAESNPLRPVATGTAYAAGAILPRALPLVSSAANLVAKSPLAQKALAVSAGAAMGAQVGQAEIGGALGGYFGSDLLAAGAKRLAQATAPVATKLANWPPRDVLGQFVKITRAHKLPSALSRMGNAMGMISGEGAALEQMNTPEAIQHIKDRFRMPGSEPEKWKPEDWKPNPNDTREDGSIKGTGFLGVLKRPDGGVSTELSINVPVDGEAMAIPTLVPTLDPDEVKWMLGLPKPGVLVPESVVQKAIDHARKRIAKGEPVFAQPGEGPR